MNRWFMAAMLASISASVQDPKPAEADPDRKRVRDRLEAVATALKTAGAISFEIEAAQGTNRTTTNYVLKRPHLARREFTYDGARHLLVADGESIFSTDEKRKTYTPRIQSEFLFDFSFTDTHLVLQLFFEAAPDRILKKQAGFSIEQGKIGESEYEIVRWSGPDRYRQQTEVKLWIDARNLPRRVERRTERGVRGGNPYVSTETEEIANLVLDPKLDAAVFAFTPPAGAREETMLEFNSPGALPETPEGKKAQEIFEAAQAMLRKVEAVEYSVEILRQGEGIDPKEAPTRRRVQAKRPNMARFEEASARWEGVYLLDGAWLWIFPKTGKTYRRSGQMDFYLTISGIHTEPYYRLFCEKNPTRVLGGAHDVKVGRENVGDVECDAIEWTQPDSMRNEKKHRFWIDADRKPRRYRLEWKYQGKTYVESVTYGPLDLAATPAAETFRFTPPADWADEGKVDMDDLLVAVGSKAPDFEATDLDGRKVKLSDFRGKAVLLNFWFST